MNTPHTPSNTAAAVAGVIGEAASEFLTPDSDAVKRVREALDQLSYGEDREVLTDEERQVLDAIERRVRARNGQPFGGTHGDVDLARLGTRTIITVGMGLANQADLVVRVSEAESEAVPS